MIARGDVPGVRLVTLEAKGLAFGLLARGTIEISGQVWLAAATLHEIGKQVRIGNWPAMGALAPDPIDAVAELGFGMVDPKPIPALLAACLD